MRRSNEAGGLRAKHALVLCIVGTALLAGCGSDPCGGVEPTEPGPNVPELTSFWKVDTQPPGDPWTVVFGLRFEDGDGDVGDGRVEFFLQGSDEAIPEDLEDSFRASGVALDAESGSLWTALRFSDGVSDGAEVELGAQIVDTAGHRSNCYTIEIRFDVTPLSHVYGVRRETVIASRGRPCGDRG